MATDKDVVLIYIEDNPLAFARIESITPDVKPNWWQVKLLLLKLPLQVVTWILREEYINGEEFTMRGNRMRLEPVVCPEEIPVPLDHKDGQQEITSKKEDAQTGEAASEPNGNGKVISLSAKLRGKNNG